MTREEYFERFERNLRVGGAKRNEILNELATHLDDANEANPVRALGNPSSLARRYDATHVGPWASGIWLFLTIVIGIFAFLPARFLLMLTPVAWQKSMIMEWLYLLRFIPPLIAALLIGLALARLRTPGRYVAVLIPITFVAINVTGLVGYRPDAFSAGDEVFLMNYLTSIFQTLFLIGMAAVPFKLERPWWNGRRQIQRV